MGFLKIQDPVKVLALHLVVISLKCFNPEHSAAFICLFLMTFTFSEEYKLNVL